jgi:hypothetical protein
VQTGKGIIGGVIAAIAVTGAHFGGFLDDAARQGNTVGKAARIGARYGDDLPSPTATPRAPSNAGAVTGHVSSVESALKDRARTASQRLADVIEDDCGPEVSPARAYGAAMSALCKAAYDMRRGRIHDDPAHYVLDELDAFKNRHECLKDHYGTLAHTVTTVVGSLFGSPPDDDKIRSFTAHVCSLTAPSQ